MKIVDWKISFMLLFKDLSREFSTLLNGNGMSLDLIFKEVTMKKSQVK